MIVRTDSQTTQAWQNFTFEGADAAEKLGRNGVRTKSQRLSHDGSDTRSNDMFPEKLERKKFLA
jgi:hypothetical protein